MSEPPLTSSVVAGSVKCVKELLNAGADVNERDEDGYTSLMTAVYYANDAIIQRL